MNQKSLFILSTILIASISFAQNGDMANRKSGILAGNRVRTTFMNNGLIAGTFNGQPSYEWPYGSGNMYIFELSFMIGAEIQIENGDTTHSVITHDGPRGWTDGPVVGDETWCFEPLGQFTNPATNSPAIYSDPTTWPTEWDSWPDILPPGSILPSEATFFVVDDSKDSEFDFYPDSTDSLRRGVGLRVEIRAYQWSLPIVEDAIFWHYRIINEGDKNLDKLVFGTMVGTAAGGLCGDSNDDMNAWDSDWGISYYYDENGYSPCYMGAIGYAGQRVIQTPLDADQNPLRLTSHFGFTPPGTLRMSNDGLLWEHLSPGTFQEIDEGSDSDYLNGIGYFSLGAGDTTDIVYAQIFATDLTHLKMVGQATWSFAENGYSELNPLGMTATLPTPGDTLQDHFQITYNAGDDPNRIVLINYKNEAELFWQTIEFDLPSTGTYDWDISNLDPGSYKLRVVAFDLLHYGQVYTDSTFYINNTSATKIEIPLPATPIIKNAFPNPFNPTSTIDFSIPERSDVSLTVYDIMGRTITPLVNQSMQPGHYEATWDGTDKLGRQVAGGTYFARLQVGEFSSVVKLVYLR